MANWMDIIDVPWCVLLSPPTVNFVTCWCVMYASFKEYDHTLNLYFLKLAYICCEHLIVIDHFDFSRFMSSTLSITSFTPLAEWAYTKYSVA